MLIAFLLSADSDTINALRHSMVSSIPLSGCIIALPNNYISLITEVLLHEVRNYESANVILTTEITFTSK